ncbi:MAG: hypothetical protein AAGF94_07165 [Pseudomonadota bacterium]
MARAVLFGSFMGLLIGGISLAVLALQVAVVDWPEAELPPDASPEPIAAPLAPPPPDGRVVTAAPGPEEPPLPSLSQLATSPAARDRLRAMAGLTQAPERAPDLSSLGEAPHLRAVARLRNPPDPRAIDLDDIEIFVPPTRFRPDPAAFEPVTVDLRPITRQLQRLSPTRLEFAGVPAKAIETTRLAAAPPQATRFASDAELGPVAFTTPDPVMQSSPVRRAAVPPKAPTPVRLNDTTPPAGPRPPTATRADPSEILGILRPPMILWIARATPDGELPSWVTPIGAPDTGAELVSLPPPNDPEALALFLAELRDAQTKPAALLVAESPAWSAPLLAPLLNRPEIRDLPLVLPPGVEPDLIDLLATHDHRVLPIYTQLRTVPTPMDLVRISARAERDGLVAVELDAATLQGWGQETSFAPASLSDAFGG